MHGDSGEGGLNFFSAVTLQLIKLYQNSFCKQLSSQRRAQGMKFKGENLNESEGIQSGISSLT